jgi:hypothetical protein
MEKARRSGEGTRLQTWELAGAGELAQTVTDWCLEVLARTRRPFGINHFDLVVSCRTIDGRVRTERFLKLQPGDLYSDTMAPRISGLAPVAVRNEPIRLAAALFSWGDAADAALPKRI